MSSAVNSGVVLAQSPPQLRGIKLWSHTQRHRLGGLGSRNQPPVHATQTRLSVSHQHHHQLSCPSCAKSTTQITMASTKDPRRPDLIVPYQEPAGKTDNPELSSTLSSTLPMAAIFMRNRYVGWAAVAFSLQSWLGESEETQKSASSPGYFAVGMSLMSLIVTYLPLFLPPSPGLQQGSSTEAPAPVPPA